VNRRVKLGIGGLAEEVSEESVLDWVHKYGIPGIMTSLSTPLGDLPLIKDYLWKFGAMESFDYFRYEAAFANHLLSLYETCA